jgi:hypothetical protein
VPLPEEFHQREEEPPRAFEPLLHMVDRILACACGNFMPMLRFFVTAER